MDYLTEILEHNTAAVYPSKDALLKKLRGQDKLRVYLGIDPSSPKIHLGNAVVLRKLSELQNLGHKIILVIGDFTGMIGDPTDKTSTRIPLTSEQVAENSKSYKEQAEKILKFSGKNSAEIAYNSTWLSKLNFADITKLAATFTVQQLLERDMFQERLKNKKPIGLHEFLYPLMQGYDSLALDVDMEIGGTDQTFNMLLGREIMKEVKGKEKFVLTLPLLEGTDGRKMSKSFSNSIDIDSPAKEMFGKLMSINDSLIDKYFELCTDLTKKEIAELKKGINSQIDLKKALALEITKLYHGQEEALAAQKEFENVVQEKQLPNEIDEIKFAKQTLPKPYLYFLLESGLCQSSSEAVRLASQGGVEVDGQKVENVRAQFSTTNNSVVMRAGKRNYIRLKFV